MRRKYATATNKRAGLNRRYLLINKTINLLYRYFEGKIKQSSANGQALKSFIGFAVDLLNGTHEAKAYASQVLSKHS